MESQETEQVSVRTSNCGDRDGSVESDESAPISLAEAKERDIRNLPMAKDRLGPEQAGVSE